MICAGCGVDLGPRGQVGRRDTCPECGADLRCCRQCRHHDRSQPNECREPQAERVLDRTRANFCDYFAVAAEPTVPTAGTSATGSREALERLFRRR